MFISQNKRPVHLHVIEIFTSGEIRVKKINAYHQFRRSGQCQYLDTVELCIKELERL